MQLCVVLECFGDVFKLPAHVSSPMSPVRYHFPTPVKCLCMI